MALKAWGRVILVLILKQNVHHITSLMSNRGGGGGGGDIKKLRQLPYDIIGPMGLE